MQLESLKEQENLKTVLVEISGCYPPGVDEVKKRLGFQPSKIEKRRKI